MPRARRTRSSRRAARRACCPRRRAGPAANTGASSSLLAKGERRIAQVREHQTVEPAAPRLERAGPALDHARLGIGRHARLGETEELPHEAGFELLALA